MKKLYQSSVLQKTFYTNDKKKDDFMSYKFEKKDLPTIISKSSNTFFSSTSNVKKPQKRTLKSTIKQSIRSDRSNRTEYYISIVENKSRQIGLCAFSVYTGKIIIGTITDNILYENSISSLNKIFPIELFVPVSQKNSFFVMTLEKHFKNCKFNFLDVSYYNENDGFSLYMQTRYYKTSFDLDTNYLAFAALNAMNSIFNTNEIKELQFELLELEIYEFNKYLLIDNNTLNELEILVNNITGKSKNCFFDLFKCRTLSGERYLRGLLTQPYKDIKSISETNNFLQFINQNYIIYQILNKELIHFKYYDNITIKFLDNPNIQSESSLLRLYNTIIDIKFFADRYINLLNILEKESENINQLFDFVKINNSAHLNIMNDISTFLEENFDFEVVKEKNNLKDNFVFFLKKDVSVFVDLSRYSYTKLYESLLELFEGYRNLVNSANFTNFKMHNTKKRKYHFRIKIKEPYQNFVEELKKVLKEEIISEEMKNNYLYFSTPSFSTLNNRLDRCTSEILFKTLEKVWDVYKKVQLNLPVLFEINFAISKLDTNIAIFEVCQKQKFSCVPFFLENEKFKFFQIKNSRYPITIKNGSLDHFQSHTYISFDSFNTSVILGETQSGKTTFLKQLAYLVILAQIGSYLPSENALLFPFSRIVSKFNSQINNETGITSDFGLDIVFFNKVEKYLQDDNLVSLILIDGFGNGTNQEELPFILKPFLSEFVKSSNHFTFLCSSKFEAFFSLLPFDLISVKFLDDFKLKKKNEKTNEDKIFVFQNLDFQKMFLNNHEKQNSHFFSQANEKFDFLENCVDKISDYFNNQNEDLNYIIKDLEYYLDNN